MCVGITIILLSPTVLGAGYAMWYQGEQMVCSNRRVDEAPPQTWSSYSAGFLALGATYYTQSLAFPLFENSKASEELKKHALETSHQPMPSYKQVGYVPPKSLTDLAKRIAPPLLLRLSASSLAFFCAGAIQTYVAIYQRE